MSRVNDWKELQSLERGYLAKQASYTFLSQKANGGMVIGRVHHRHGDWHLFKLAIGVELRVNRWASKRWLVLAYLGWSSRCAAAARS